MLKYFIKIRVAILSKGFGEQLKLVKLGCGIHKLLIFKYSVSNPFFLST